MGNLLNVHFEIQPSKIYTLSQFTRQDGDLSCVCVHMCGLSVDCVCRALLCVAVNRSRFLPGGHEDEPKGRVKQDWVSWGWKLRS